MSDEEKIAWFNETMDWINQWGSSDAAAAAANDCGDAPYDLFFDAIEQYKKDRE